LQDSEREGSQPELNTDEGLGYPGWRIVAGMFVVTAALFGSTIYAFIILAEHMATERSWSASSSGNLVSAMWLVSPLALFCAPLISRVGPWRVMLSGLAILAAAFAVMPAADSFWQAYLLRMLMGAGKTLAIVSMPVIVADAFSRRFGLAIAVAWCGGAFGGLALSPLAELLVSAFGWRLTALSLAGLMLAVASMVFALGRTARAWDARQRRKSVATDDTDTSRTYWARLRGIDAAPATVMALAVAASGVAVLAFAIEMPPFLQARGFSPTVAATVLGLSAAGGMIGNLLAGWLLDRWRSEFTSLAMALTTSAGLLSFAMLDSQPLMMVASAGSLLFGVGLGSAEILWITLTKRQFGADLFPLTYGGWSFCYSVGYALAGSARAAANEVLGGTEFLLFIAVLCAPTLIFSVWRPHVRNHEPATGVGN